MKKSHIKEAFINIKERAEKIRLKQCVRNIVLLHPVLLTALILVLLFFSALIICWISVEISLGKRMKLGEGVYYLYTQWDVATGLSLLVGYLGMGATVVLGLIALRFSFKTEEGKRIEELQKININSIKFYDMYEGVVPSEMKYDDIKECRFLLKIELSGEKSNYEYQVDRVWWGVCGEDYSNSDPRVLNHCKVYVENAAIVTLYVYFNEFETGSGKEKDSENGISFFYHIGEYEPLLMRRDKRHRWIQLDMYMREKVWTEKRRQGGFMAKLEILAENRNEGSGEQKWIELYEISHNIKINNTNEMR